jgi:AcrR family transcriptional regulator
LASKTPSDTGQDPAAPVRTRVSRIDGRRLRSERTRQLIIEAYLALLWRNQRMPTAAQIAAEAGYSTRSIFERFADLNALTLATADYAIAQAQAEATPQDVDADRASRIRSHVATRAAACERWLPLWRVLIRTQEDVPELRTRVVLARYGNIERMRLMYRPELAALSDSEREGLLFVLGTLVSFESWDQMRSAFGQSDAVAQAAWRDAIDRLLPPTPPRAG